MMIGRPGMRATPLNALGAGGQDAHQAQRQQAVDSLRSALRCSFPCARRGRHGSLLALHGYTWVRV